MNLQSSSNQSKKKSATLLTGTSITENKLYNLNEKSHSRRENNPSVADRRDDIQSQRQKSPSNAITDAKPDTHGRSHRNATISLLVVPTSIPTRAHWYSWITSRMWNLYSGCFLAVLAAAQCSPTLLNRTFLPFLWTAFGSEQSSGWPTIFRLKIIFLKAMFEKPDIHTHKYIIKR